MEILLLIIYGIFISFIFLYSLIQLHLVLIFWKEKKTTLPSYPMNTESSWPMVTVQLPIYNERYVIERLLASVSALEYPQEKLEIQVLDDSEDETVELIDRLVSHYQAQGLPISVVRRPKREGFKAGALDYGLQIAQGDFIAIFDADFMPQTSFLKETLAPFQDEKVGLVQTRWQHLNEDYSILTQMQAFALNAHFTVEQEGRNRGGFFMNFNGTAGVWRKTCIQDAGGWQSDTLTEDLDLSYRAQLKDWKFVYLKDVGTPAELPVELNALKNQQFRWTKGAAECARKNLGSVLRKKDLGLGTKLHALFHLGNSFIFIAVLMISVLSVPLLWVKQKHPEYGPLFQLATFFLLSFAILGVFYASSEYDDPQKSKSLTWKFLPRFLVFLSLSMGLSLHNAIAVFEGYIGKKSPFIRTPKFNVRKKQDAWQKNQYLQGIFSGLTLIELALALYFAYGLGLGIYYGDFGLFPFHLMLTFGFGYISLYTFKHAWQIRKNILQHEVLQA